MCRFIFLTFCCVYGVRRFDFMGFFMGNTFSWTFDLGTIFPDRATPADWSGNGLLPVLPEVHRFSSTRRFFSFLSGFFKILVISTLPFYFAIFLFDSPTIYLSRDRATGTPRKPEVHRTSWPFFQAQNLLVLQFCNLIFRSSIFMARAEKDRRSTR